MTAATILLRTPSGMVGRLISWQTRGEFSHAAILLDGLVWEVGGGSGLDPVTCYPEAKLTGEWHRRYVRIEDAQAAEMCLWLYDQLGKPYDLTMVARFVSRRGETRKSAGKWFCSELVAAAFAHVGVPLFLDTEPWEVAPSWLPRSLLVRREP